MLDKGRLPVKSGSMWYKTDRGEVSKRQGGGTAIVTSLSPICHRSRRSSWVVKGVSACNTVYVTEKTRLMNDGVRAQCTGRVLSQIDCPGSATSMQLQGHMMFDVCIVDTADVSTTLLYSQTFLQCSSPISYVPASSVTCALLPPSFARIQFICVLTPRLLFSKDSRYSASACRDLPHSSQVLPETRSKNCQLNHLPYIEVKVTFPEV